MHSDSPDEAQAHTDEMINHFGPFGRGLLLICKFVATLGGLAFVALVIMSIFSIVGRKLFSAPVPGDMEILMMVAASASATFFAYCHLVGGDIKVDFFTSKLSPKTNHYLDAIASLLVGLFGAVISWRSGVGAMSIMTTGDSSAILGWPIWIAQSAMVPGFILLTLAGVYMCIRHIDAAHSITGDQQ